MVSELRTAPASIPPCAGHPFDLEGSEPEHELRRVRVAELEAWAAEVLTDPHTAALDVRCANRHRAARIVELAAVAAAGQVLVDALIGPVGPQPARVGAVRPAPEAAFGGAAFGDLVPFLEQVLCHRRIVVYDAPLAMARLGRELARWRGEQYTDPGRAAIRWLAALGTSTEDAAGPYSEWVGERFARRGGYRRQPASGEPAALAGCLAVIDRLEQMAGTTAETIPATRSP